MTAPNGPPSPAVGAAYPRLSLRRLAPLIVVIVLSVGVVAFGWHRQISFEQVARHHEARSAVGEYFVRRAGPLAEKLAQGFRADAFSYLLFLRLVPIFPFWVVNLVAALAGARLATFVAATVLGIIPPTFIFAFFGA